jgi:hypothetical protein
MFLKRSLLTAVSLAALLAAAAEADQSINAAHDSLVAFNDRFNARAANYDIEGLVALYDKNAYWIAPDAFPVRGRDGVPRQTITFMSENKGELTHTID